MKKKWIALFLSCVMAASLCACGGDEEEAASPSVSAASGEEGTWSIYWSRAAALLPAIWQN